VTAVTWHAMEATVFREAREAVEYGLMETGALGTETRETDNRVRVTGYYDRSIDVATVQAGLVEAFRIYNLAPTSLIELKTSEVPDRDWLAEWKKGWQPVEVGRFVVAPPWITSVPPASAGGSKDQIVVRINPGMAFGTGTHETTRLCLKMIEKYFGGGSFLDVGTGTGILAIAAAKMFSDGRVEACDTDADAISIAAENARRNGVYDRIKFRVGTVGNQTPSADLVCANLTAPAIVDLLPSLIGATCGRLVLSGILDSQFGLVESRLQELGATILESDQDGEWKALVV